MQHGKPQSFSVLAAYSTLEIPNFRTFGGVANLPHIRKFYVYIVSVYMCIF